MTSNTKLTSEQKLDRKMLKNTERMQGAQIVNNGADTIVFKVLGNSVEFATSSASPDELKFRRKVGEFHAMERFQFGETSKLGKESFQNILDTGFYDNTEKDGCPLVF